MMTKKMHFHLSQLLMLLLLGGACALYYEEGFDHYYSYSSESDVLGLHNVTTVVKFRVRAVNSSSDDGNLNMLMVDSFVQYTEKGNFADNPLKWDLDREFLFIVGMDGLVTMVHHHPEDEQEILTLKKVLASTLSAKVLIKNEANWHFTSEELDHAGTLEHSYKGERTKTGVKLERTHSSSTDVLRFHNKTLHLDHKGTPLDIESLDNITLHHNPNQIKRKPMEGEEEIIEEQSGEFPKIGSISRSKVKLEAKRPHDEISHRPLTNLVPDKLSIKQKEPEKVSLFSVEAEVRQKLECIRRYENKYDRNRTECVNQLRKLLKSVHEDDLFQLASKVLTRKCGVNDTVCKDERNLFIDLVSGHGSHGAQLLILDLIVLQPNVTEEDLRRFLFHCIPLKTPHPDVVKIVEDLCHSEIEYKEGVPSMTKTGKRACLSLGAMAKTLHETNVTVSDRIVERLESWLEPHNQTESSEIIKPRKRRSISEMDRRSRKHIETKMVLLQSLGNAGKKRSLRHIKSYMEPNAGSSVWRRAAAHSLRHFDCDESATALLKSAVHDKDEVVRQTARKVFENHPKSVNITKEQEDIVLSKNYSYPMVSRVRRGAREVLETLIEGIAFRIEAPGLSWKKTIGSDDIGASLGLELRNLVDFELKLMKGHFLVDVYDGAFAEVHVAMMDFKIDILKAFICFKGHINYNMNILKDFGINDAQDLLNIYDKIIDKIVNPIKEVIQGFKDIIHLFRSGTITEVFNSFVTMFKSLPLMVVDLSRLVWEFVKNVYSVSGSVIIEELKTVVRDARQYVDGVKQDVLKFYNMIADAVTTGLPYIGKKVKEAFLLVVDGFKAIIDSPVQSMTGMTRGVSQIKTAVAMAVDVKEKVVETVMLVKGRITEWLTTGKVIPKLLKRFEAALDRLSTNTANSEGVTDDVENSLSTGVRPMRSYFGALKDKILAKWDLVLAPFRELENVAQPFLDTFKDVMDLIKGMKWAFKKLKDVIEIGKSLVQKVFGPKFHPKFPKIRRKEGGGCSAGMYPTDTDGTFDTEGVDLLIGSGSTIPAPLDCIIHIKDEGQAVLQPTDNEFDALEIVVENFKPLDDVNGKRFKAGDTIGEGIDTNVCKDNFFHLSVRKAQNDSDPDVVHQYTDPSPFLDKITPLSKWIQECNDYEFRFVGQTFDSGETEDKEGDGEPQAEEKSLKRSFEESVGTHEDLDEMMNRMGSEKKRRSFGDILDKINSFGDDFTSGIKEKAKNFGEFFKTSLFNKEEPEVPNVSDIVSLNDHSVSWVLDKLKGGSETASKLTGVIDHLSKGITKLPSGDIEIQPLPMLKRLFPEVEGGVTELTEALEGAAEKLCSAFIGAIGSGQLCTPRCDCLGAICSIPLQKQQERAFLDLGFYLNLDEQQLELLYHGTLFILPIDGLDHEFDLGFSALSMNVTLVGNIGLNIDKFTFSVEVKLCSSFLKVCLPNIEVLTNIEFDLDPPNITSDTKACSPDGKSLGEMAAVDEIKEMSIPDFVSMLGEFSLLDGDTMGMLDGIRGIASEELMDEPADMIGPITVEFHDGTDFCIGTNITFPNLDITFFELVQHFMVGPVPLSLGFGAGGVLGLGANLKVCIMTMKLRVVLTPLCGGKVWGDVALSLGFVRGGVRLIGFIIECKFPITGELAFTKFPIDLGGRLDLMLTPVRLQLKGFAELTFPKATIWEGTIWKYAMATINKNIFNKHTLDKDVSPPQISPYVFKMKDKMKREEPHEGCTVEQVLGRQYYDTAFQIEMNAQDPTSEVKISYAIGTHKGGTNVVDWTEIGGFQLLEPARLPGGRSLYWTMKAKNSQGLEAIAQCSLNTYDSTLPDGRVEHAYKFSSHPHKLIAAVVVFEDSPLVDTHYKAVGYSPGEFGSQFVNWQEISLDHSVERLDGSEYLRKFTVPREGKLVAPVLQTQKITDPEECAKLCHEYGPNCVSFDYETHSETCDFHDLVQGANAYLRLSGTYKNYERLGTGYHNPIEYNDLQLEHGILYFVNAKITNVLAYEAFLFGEGTMVDFTPPEPGPVGNVSQDLLRADGCGAAVTQQCIDVTWKENHRIIIDGPGANTVFSGHEPLIDNLYTLTNHYISANWDGFHDDESGIWGYTWAVGRTVCGTDIFDYEDPHYHLTNKRFWTNSGFKKGFHLSDGAYYVTIQALNSAELGGSLVTTVCHSIPFNVDTSPPVFSGVTEVIYDEDFDLIAIYYEASDDLSKIAKAEFGLGKTKFDVQLKAYSLHEAMERIDPFVSVEDLGLQEGIPAWIRIRVTNNVDLFTTGHGDEPILIDRSPPFPGTVIDGDILEGDLRYQYDDKQICAQWRDFYDSESGINSYLWGVGTQPGEDDIVEFKSLTHYDKSDCAVATLEHNMTYYSTVLAYNNALNAKTANASSDGVLVDVTPPITTPVTDGKETDEKDMEYTSETATKACHWSEFFDPESGIEKYLVDVYINDELKDTFDVELDTRFEDKTISLEHNDHVHFSVHGVNGAGQSTAAETDGFTVDHTPPVLTEISESETGSRYQKDNTAMHLMWNFKDDQSGIKEYRTMILETKQGIKQKIWPSDALYNSTFPESKFSARVVVILEGLALANGGKYSLHVTSFNGALMSTAHESVGVIVDMTPPNAPKVHIGILGEEEDVNEAGEVVHSDQHGILVSWSARDSESGIHHYSVAVGTSDDAELLLPFTNYGSDTTAYINNIHFETSQESGITYVVSVVAVNGAEIPSPIGVSKSIFIQKANVPGVVFDGRRLYEDEEYTFDRSSLAASFYGFESESCNILRYEWAIGKEAYGTDILTYTNYGLVMQNFTHGHMQIHIGLSENIKYFITVRAVTGCREEYIVSSSNGITLDTTPPVVTFIDKTDDDTTLVLHNGVWYQDTTDTLDFTADVNDSQEVVTSEWTLGSVPEGDDLHLLTNDLPSITNVIMLAPGEPAFITARASDGAGNIEIASSPPVIGDSSPPHLLQLDCTKYISIIQGLVTCEWQEVIEYESVVQDIFISIGTASQLGDILQDYEQPLTKRHFSKDMTNILKEDLNISAVYFDFKVINVVGRINEYEHKAVVDHTPPTVQGVTVVTRTNNNQPYIPLKCQLPQSFVEINLRSSVDEESGIDENRFEVALGSEEFASDILAYKPVEFNSDNVFFINGLTIPIGSTFFATVRSYNKAGLNGESSSGGVVVSQLPVLEVSDGAADYDIDFQSTPNIIQGSWKHSDDCPIIEASWKIHDLIGNTLEDYRNIPDLANDKLYNDEVQLQVGVKYFITVKTLDALNRTKISRSDGVTVRIQPPFPGGVRDGEDEDLEYQYSVTELSANWNDFGDSSNDPTQSIDHYEVAIGNDHRYESTRSNVHSYVNVGLNKHITFSNLNLTAKVIPYYITVRGYSLAGGFAESYSNGIRVGFTGNLIPGTIASNRFQTSTQTVSLSWNNFESDIGIVQYTVGLSSHEPSVIIDPIVCTLIANNRSIFDIALEDVDLNEYVEIDDLNLLHGASYFPTVMAVDASGICSVVTGKSITVDTTPPNTGDVYINEVLSELRLFAESSSELHVRWVSFEDPESGIHSVKVSLLDCGPCDASAPTCFTLAEENAQNDTNVNFYELELVQNNVYKIRVDVSNGAGSIVSVLSPVILLDVSPPGAGSVKITDDWKLTKSFQSDITSIRGRMAVTLSETIHRCENQYKFFPPNNRSTEKWDLPESTYSKDFTVINKTGGFFGIGYNADLTKMIKSGLSSPPLTLRNGNYSSALRCAKGSNIITTLAFISTTDVIPYEIKDKPLEPEFDKSIFDNKTALNANRTETVTQAPGVMKETNESRVSDTSLLSENDFGFGFHILGYNIDNNVFHNGLFWARSKYFSVERWFNLDFDPAESEHIYSIAVDKYIDDQEEITDLSLFVDDKELVSIFDLELGTDAKIALLTWNENNSKPLISDVFNPFYSEAFVQNIYVPEEEEKECLHGGAFYDGESGIKEIWAGVSDSESLIDNIAPLQLLHQFCPACNGMCNTSCIEDCDYATIDEDFMIVDLFITGLQLKEVKLDDGCLNITSDSNCNSTSYYVTTKVVNFAGQSTYAHSNAIQVDPTPPTCEYVKCLDPDHAEDQPTSHLGSSSTIGAYWKCSDDISLIEDFEVSVSSIDEQATIMNTTNVGRKSKISFNLGNDTFKERHNYAVQLTVYNTAGMSETYNCSVEVHLSPPNVDATESKPLYGDQTTVDGETVITDSQDKIGVEWLGGTDEVELFEWQVGTRPGGSDIFPPLIVGVNSSGSAAIVDGQLVLNSLSTNKTLSEFETLVSGSIDDVDAEKNKTHADNTFFSLEPGRCSHHTMTAVGWSHLKSSLKSKSVCIKRAQDIVLEQSTLAPRQIVSKPLLSNTWTQNLVASPEVVVDASVSQGSMIVGSLSTGDKSTPYGTAASSTFKSYISDPAITKLQTSRRLRNRLTKFCDVAFFIAPAPSLTYDDIAVNITVPDACKEDDEQQPALASWNSEAEYWQHEDEGCSSDLAAKGTSEIYTTNICSSLRPDSVTRRRRSTSVTTSTPTAFELVTITKTYINSPPNITTDQIVTVEDAFTETAIETYDLEEDELMFEIAEQPVHANCTVNSSGILDCVFEDDFFGEDQITINVTEINLAADEVPNSVVKTIPVIVEPVPDLTDRFFVDPIGEVYRDKRPKMVRTYYTDANFTTMYYAGVIILATVDGDETFTYETYMNFTALGSSTVSLKEVPVASVYADNLTLSYYRTVKAYNVTFSYSKLLSGKMTLYFIATTKEGAFTPNVIIEMYILNNPCVYGICSHTLTGTAGCHDVTRSEGFDDFYCVCSAGFTDQWCQTNINECAPEPCAILFDCEDGVNSYRCNINIPKLMAILLSSFIAVGLIIFITIRLIKRQKKDSSHVLLVKACDAEDEPNPLFRRPTMYRELSEGSIPPFNLFTVKSKNESQDGDIKAHLPMFGLGQKAPAHHMLGLIRPIGKEESTLEGDGDMYGDPSTKESPMPENTHPPPEELKSARSIKENNAKLLTSQALKQSTKTEFILIDNKPKKTLQRPEEVRTFQPAGRHAVKRAVSMPLKKSPKFNFSTVEIKQRQGHHMQGLDNPVASEANLLEAEGQANVKSELNKNLPAPVTGFSKKELISPPGTPNRLTRSPGTPNRLTSPPGTPNRLTSLPGTPNRLTSPPGTPNRLTSPPGTPNRPKNEFTSVEIKPLETLPQPEEANTPLSAHTEFTFFDSKPPAAPLEPEMKAVQPVEDSSAKIMLNETPNADLIYDSKTPETTHLPEAVIPIQTADEKLAEAIQTNSTKTSQETELSVSAFKSSEAIAQAEVHTTTQLSEADSKLAETEFRPVELKSQETLPNPENVKPLQPAEDTDAKKVPAKVFKEPLQTEVKSSDIKPAETVPQPEVVNTTEQDVLSAESTVKPDHMKPPETQSYPDSVETAQPKKADIIPAEKDMKHVDFEPPEKLPQTEDFESVQEDQTNSELTATLLQTEVATTIQPTKLDFKHYDFKAPEKRPQPEDARPVKPASDSSGHHVPSQSFKKPAKPDFAKTVEFQPSVTTKVKKGANPYLDIAKMQKMPLNKPNKTKPQKTKPKTGSTNVNLASLSIFGQKGPSHHSKRTIKPQEKEGSSLDPEDNQENEVEESEEREAQPDKTT